MLLRKQGKHKTEKYNKKGTGFLRYLFFLNSYY